MHLGPVSFWELTYFLVLHHLSGVAILMPELPASGFKQDVDIGPKGSQSDPLSGNFQFCMSEEARVGGKGAGVCCMADQNCPPVRLPLVFVWSSCLFEN